MTTFKPFQYFGTWIRATLNFSDLFPAFVELLRELEKELPPTHPRTADGFEDQSSELFNQMGSPEWLFMRDDLLHELIERLNAFAPDYCYFGAHEADGSDFGFWVDHFGIEEDTDSGDLLSVSDLGEIPGDYVGDVLLVNDHGNMSLHFIGIDDVLKEKWSIV